MKTSYKISALLTLIALFIIAALYYENKLNNAELINSSKNTKPAKSVNVLVNSMELVINDDEGLIKSKLVANKLKHHADSDLTELTNPTLIVNQADSSWEIIAETGMIIHNKVKIKQIDEIILSSNVKITRLNHNNAKFPYLILETSKISYFPNTDLISSKEHVMITTKDSKTTATGLKFNKSDQKLQLLSNVVSTYQTANITSNTKLNDKKI